MGCDIHVHTEVKINGEWHHYDMPYVRRDYALFSRLANVRNYRDDHAEWVEPISDPRGLPEDASFLTKFDSEKWGTDGHSHSWIGAEEIHNLKDWMENELTNETGKNPGPFFFEDIFGFLFGNSWDNFVTYRNDYPKEIEDIRWVFWFDN